MLSHLVYIGLGSNLSDPLSQLNLSLSQLQQHPDLSLETVSSFYRSKPLGPADQPDFINAVAKFKTGLAPMALLRCLQGIENNLHRNRNTKRWGPRTIDLDILTYDNDTVNTPELTIPHSQIKLRNFVILPFSEIAEGFQLPCGDSLSSLAKTCSKNGIIKIQN